MLTSQTLTYWWQVVLGGGTKNYKYLYPISVLMIHLEVHLFPKKSD